MPFIFKKDQEIKIYLNENEPESLKLAVDNLKEDIESIFGKAVIIDDQMKADILVASDSSFVHDEEYFYYIGSGRIYLTGKDDLGAMWAIYSFLENELNVPPFYKIEGLKLQQKKTLLLEDKTVTGYPHTRFRGWFINDEDLLGGFKTLGKRNGVDYEYYQDVIHPDMMNLLAETILRYRMNLVIPSTLVDITNPYEEKLVEICSKRGLYISQHHIEPMGVSKFGFKKFANENGLDDTFSYVSNKETLLSCYKYYCEKWSKYPRVIWQLGLRGGTDRPVWTSDKNVGNSDEERGELIGSAIKDQFNIVKETYPYEIYTSSTLWMEGADLLKKGVLKLPKDTIVVFSDVGMTQMFGDDFFSVKRNPNRLYGVYYHAAFWHTGPHLAEGVLPIKMKYCYDLVREYQSDYYSIMNVANVKELTFSIYLNSKLTFEESITLDEIFNKYTKLYLEDNEELIKAIKGYYSALGDIGENEYEEFALKYNFSYHKYENLPFPVCSINDGMIRSIPWLVFQDRNKHLTELTLETLTKGHEIMSSVHKQFKNIAMDLEEEYVTGFNQHWTYQSLYYSLFLKEGIYYYQAIKEYENQNYSASKENFMKCVDIYDQILEERKNYYFGEWEDYFRDERKIGVKKLKANILEEVEERLKGY